MIVPGHHFLLLAVEIAGRDLRFLHFTHQPAGQADHAAGQDIDFRGNLLILRIAAGDFIDVQAGNFVAIQAHAQVEFIVECQLVLAGHNHAHPAGARQGVQNLVLKPAARLAGEEVIIVDQQNDHFFHIGGVFHHPYQQLSQAHLVGNLLIVGWQIDNARRQTVLQIAQYFLEHSNHIEGVWRS